MLQLAPKGTAENNHVLIRRIIPKGTSLFAHENGNFNSY